MKYLILTIPSVDYAKGISHFLYALSVPALNYTTQYYNAWLVHPQTNEVALGFPENSDIPIHPNADAELLVDQVRNAITEEEAQAMEDRINEGGNVTPLDFIPQSLGGNIRTKEEMQLSGWFEEINQ